MALKIRKGDKVTVIAGKDKGKKGKILRVQKAVGRVIIEGVNLTKKHTRPTQQNPQGGIIQRESSIDISNVKLICPGCSQPTRIGMKIEDSKKTRTCKKCNAEIR